MRIYKPFVVAILAASFAGTAHAKNKERVLPDACGSDAVQFDLASHKADTVPPPPADGKAQIVFIQTLTVKNYHVFHHGISDFTARFGLDGAWVGAAGDNSYITVDVAPGEHHLCGSVQGSNKAFQDMVGATSLNAEAGKVYYYEFKVLVLVERSIFYNTTFQAIEPDEGKFRVKAYSLSVATPHH